MNKPIKGSFLLVTLLILLCPFKGFAQEDIKLWMNGNYIKSDVKPLVEKNRTLVPLRVVSENLGLHVEWKGDLNQVIISKEEDTYIFFIGENYYLQGTVQKPLDVPPKVSNNRTFVPIRVIAEAFDQKVIWDGASQTVAIGEGFKPTPSPVKPVPATPSPIKSSTPGSGANNWKNYTPDTSQGKIKGNKNSKIYHVPGGRDYNKISQRNVVYFNSEQEAQNAGYRRAKK